MQNLSSTVLVALGGVLVVFGYHALVVAPQMRRLGRAVDAHDALIGGVGGSATDRIVSLETALAELQRRGVDLERRLAALEDLLAKHLPHIGFVRYNASFDKTGPDLSYAFALLTKRGDGVVLSSNYTREEVRTYGKAVAGFVPAQDVSEEEQAAIAQARLAAS